MKKLITFLLTLSFFFTSWSQEYKKMKALGNYTVQEIQTAAKIHFDEKGRGKGTGYKQFKRWEYKALRKMDENGYLKSPEFYYNELQRYKAYLNSSKNAKLASVTGNWEDLGPTVKNQTSGWNPGVGRLTSVVIDANNLNHIIVGAVEGGVWKSLDAGSTWEVLTDDLSNLSVTALTIDPIQSNIYYWGSDEGIIFKSIDSGATWTLLSDTGNGRVNKILIDPNNTTKMYCSVQYGGIFKSTDSGATWASINTSASTGFDIEFKPGNTNVIYATGNEFYISTDGGATFNAPNSLPLWTQKYTNGNVNWSTSASNQNGTVIPKTGAKMAYFYVGNFSAPVTSLISPELNLQTTTNPQLKFSYTNVEWAGDIDELRVLYKTSATGTWIELANYTSETTVWTDITLNLPNKTATYYIAFEGTAKYARGITLDDVSVEDAALGIVFQDGFESTTVTFGSGAKMMGVSPDDPNVIYILEELASRFGDLYKSTDSGTTFTKLNHTGKNYFGYSSTASDDRGQAPRDMDIAVKPTDVNEVHIAGILTWMSIDGGTTFNVTSQWTPGNAAAQNIGYCHADVDILLFSGNNLYAGTDGGIFVANNTTTINNSYFTDLSEGLGIRQFYKIGVNQSITTMITGGSQDNGTSVYDKATDIWKDWLGADGMESFIDKNNNAILYGTSQFGSLYKSVTAGNSFYGITKPNGKSGSWVTPFEQDPILANVIYVAYDNVYKSINGGGSWSAISQVFAGNLNELKIAPSNNLIMYVSDGSTLYKTINGGATNWTTLSGTLGSINSIAIHPTNPNKVAIATTGSQKVYVSINGGTTWTSYLHNLPNFNALSLVWENNGKDGLYVGMDYGVYYIDNTTSTVWLPFTNNLANVAVNELEINATIGKIYAATYGRGVWESDLYDNIVLSVNEEELADIKVYPNPAKNQLNVKWDENELVSVKIYNSIGKLVYFAKSVSLINTLTINTTSLANGLYFVKLNTKNKEITKKIIVK